MKISTSYLFDRATQAQMAASKQILSPSDSPDKAAAIQRLKGEVQRQESNSRTLQVALQRYKAEETALNSSSDILTRLKELSVQAANDTLGPEDRKAVGTEMQALRDQLVSLGNTQDDSGNYLFSGTRVSTPAFAANAEGKIEYMGDQTQTRIPAGADGQSTGFFDALDQVIQAVNSSNTAGIQQGISDLEQMHSGLTISLAQTGSDQKVVQSHLDVLDETTLRTKSTLSDIEDLDYAEAVTQMNKQMMAMEAAMGSFSKISGLSLFEYIR